MKKIILSIIITLSLNIVFAQDCTDGNILLNGDFETGDYTDWVITDLYYPYFPIAVECQPYITALFDQISPFEGNCLAVNGFDGGWLTLYHQKVLIACSKCKFYLLVVVLL